jgi:hypothetical protein
MNTLERYIVVKLIADMRTAGYQVAAVWDDGDYVMGQDDGSVKSTRRAKDFVRPLTDAEALDAIDSVEISTLHFTHQNKTTWGDRGVMLVPGNGSDIMSDWHDVIDEPFNAIIERICDTVEDRDTAQRDALRREAHGVNPLLCGQDCGCQSKV